MTAGKEGQGRQDSVKSKPNRFLQEKEREVETTKKVGSRRGQSYNAMKMPRKVRGGDTTVFTLLRKNKNSSGWRNERCGGAANQNKQRKLLFIHETVWARAFGHTEGNALYRRKREGPSAGGQS